MDDRRTEAADTTSPARRAALLASLTELFGSAGAAVSPSTAALYGEIIVGVFDAMAEGDRAILVERVAELPNAPAALLHFLSLRDIETAGPVLRRSIAFADVHLAALAERLPQDRLCAIASRSQVSEPVSDALLARGDRTVLRLLARNPGARFSQRGLAILVDEAAQTLAQRQAAASSESADERGQVLDIRSAPAVSRSRRMFAKPSGTGIVIPLPPRPRGPADDAADVGSSSNAIAEVIATVATGDRMLEVAGLLAEFAGLAVDTVSRMIARPDTMPLAVLCKAAGVNVETFAAIAAIRGRRHGHSEATIAALVRAYEILGPDDVASTLHFLRARHGIEIEPAVPAVQNPTG
ncbi:MAG: DUF2336 domain-containing protein [Candidatus Kaistia colombiensis]|nr:MAG: DUF2336 domain-containing protein [Kaistia sp.]